MRIKAKFKRGDVIGSYIFGGKRSKSNVLQIVGRNATCYLIEYWHPEVRQSNFWTCAIKDTERFYEVLSKEDLELLRILL